MEAIVGYKYRIYPNKQQIELINKTIGSMRFVYNYFLAAWVYRTDIMNFTNCKYSEIDEAFIKAVFDVTGIDSNGEPLPYFNFASRNTLNKYIVPLKNKHEWLKEIPAKAIISELDVFSKAIKNSINSGFGKPKFKSKYSPRKSYIQQIQGDCRIEGNKLLIPKVGWVRIVESRKLIGDIKYLAVTKTSTGKYYVSLTVKREVKEWNKTGKSVGIDLGLSSLAVLSDGTIYEPLKLIKEYQEKLTRAQRILDRRKPKNGENSSKRYLEQKIRVAKIHEKIKNTRKYWHDKITSEIVQNYDIICIETMNVSNMLKNKKLAKAISDAAWYMFTEMLKKKCAMHGKTFVEVPAQNACSQICSRCGERNRSVKDLSIREWTCSSCNITHDRDLNASKNVLDIGLKLLLK